MAETAKYTPINGGTLITDLRTQLSLLKTKKTVACAYGFVFVFIVVTTFLAFSPSPNSSSPWFTNIFSLSKEEDGGGFYRSQFSSVFSNLFPKSSDPQVQNLTASVNVPRTSKSNFGQPHLDKKAPIGEKTLSYTQSDDKVGVLENPLNSSSVVVPRTSKDNFEQPHLDEKAPIGEKTQSYTQSDDKVGVLKNPLNSSGVVVPRTSKDNFEQPHLDEKAPIGEKTQSYTQSDDKVGVLENPLNSSSVVVPRTSKDNFEQPHLDEKAPIGEKTQNYTQSDDKVGVLEKPLSSSSVVKNQTQSKDFDDKVEILKANESTIQVPKSAATLNQTQSNDSDDKVGILKANQSTIQVPESAETVNQTQSKDFDDKVGILKANQSSFEVPKSAAAVNQTQSKDFNDKVRIFKANQTRIEKKSEEKSANGNGEKGITEKELVKSLLNCDFFDGNWETDESYPLYKPGPCSLIDEQFNCFLNDRPDTGYFKMKWKPKACSLPRLNATHMLELLRGKRLVFVGDSLNRNMWESLICILKNSVKDQKKVYEEFGRHHFRTEASYSFIFEEYKSRVEFFASPFLVQQWEVADKNGGKKETLRLDLIGESADKYKDSDIIVFNTGHWWTHEKTSLGKDYYQEGSHVHKELNVLEAFRRALTTWGKWVDAHINPKKTFVLFRGYSASHFSGGQWNSGGACDSETEPIKNDTYLTPYPSKMMALENVFKGMKTPVSYLNITRMTDYRKDGHPSVYRKPNLTLKERKLQWRYQDCSHWCLPGVPDAWNELLYAELLVRQHQKVIR